MQTNFQTLQSYADIPDDQVPHHVRVLRRKEKYLVGIVSLFVLTMIGNGALLAYSIINDTASVYIGVLSLGVYAASFVVAKRRVERTTK